MAKRQTIVICSSAAFYKQVNQIAAKLEEMGYNVVVPATATSMGKTGDYRVSRVKTWINNPKHLHLKVQKTKGHFEEVAKGDAVLIVNEDKPDQARYLGPNTVMEWGLAYYLNKPVFMLHGVSKAHNAYEEVHGLSTIINGDLRKIKI